MHTYHAYAAPSAKAPLEPFTFDPGPLGPEEIDDMLEFSARHSVAPITETFPMSQVNEALEHLRAGKARYRIVLVNDAA
jgi:hypothetical protein